MAPETCSILQSNRTMCRCWPTKSLALAHKSDEVLAFTEWPMSHVAGVHREMDLPPFERPAEAVRFFAPVFAVDPAVVLSCENTDDLVAEETELRIFPRFVTKSVETEFGAFNYTGCAASSSSPSHSSCSWRSQ